MKEILIQARLLEDVDKLGTLIKYRGFEEGDNEESVQNVLLSIGIIENIKQQLLEKLGNINKRIK